MKRILGLTTILLLLASLPFLTASTPSIPYITLPELDRMERVGNYTTSGIGSFFDMHKIVGTDSAIVRAAADSCHTIITNMFWFIKPADADREVAFFSLFEGTATHGDSIYTWWGAAPDSAGGTAQQLGGDVGKIHVAWPDPIRRVCARDSMVVLKSQVSAGADTIYIYVYGETVRGSSRGW